MDVYERLKSLGGKPIKSGINPNQFRSDPLSLSFNEPDVARFNAVYTYLYGSDLNQIKRTPSGGIAVDRSNRYAWDIFVSQGGLRITAIVDGCIFCWRLGRIKFNASNMKGWKAWRIFVKMCAENGIDLEKMAIPNGPQVKKSIQKPYIRFLLCHTVLENCNHIDFHSSYASGLAITHPEFRPIVEKLYRQRKLYPYYKDVLNCVIGYMQSVPKCRAKWAHLSRDAINNNNTRIDALSVLLEASGRRIVGYNTDGIWYQGEPYHDPRNGEGDGVGKWHNDHVNCKLRAKSDGAYEFIENGKYNAVVRGMTRLDETSDRKDWKWGDIYQEKADIIKYRFEEGVGVILMDPSEESEEYGEDGEQ